MFLLKSAFWLTIGFILVAPHGVDLGAAANAASAKAVDAGQRFIVSQILETNCTSCAGSQVNLAVAHESTPSVDPTMQDSSSGPIPFPRPRPDWMG